MNRDGRRCTYQVIDLRSKSSTYVEERHFWMGLTIAEQSQIQSTVHQLERGGYLLIGEAVESKMSLDAECSILIANGNKYKNLMPKRRNIT